MDTVPFDYAGNKWYYSYSIFMRLALNLYLMSVTSYSTSYLLSTAIDLKTVFLTTIVFALGMKSYSVLGSPGQLLMRVLNSSCWYLSYSSTSSSLHFSPFSLYLSLSLDSSFNLIDNSIVVNFNFLSKSNIFRSLIVQKLFN